MSLTPMMQQYLDVHDQVKDAILFFRLGDFYEMFFDDAILVSKELDLTLTGKDCGLDERAPMCGVPHHSAEVYIARLIEKGYKVAICEQVSDPKTSKKLVDREIIRIISPGTQIDNRFLDPEANNFLMAITADKATVGCAFLDFSTGEFFLMESELDTKEDFLINQITTYNPSEILISSKLFEDQKLIETLKNRTTSLLEPFPKENFDLKKAKKRITDQFDVYSIDSLGLTGKYNSVKAAGALLKYLDDTQKKSLDHINKISFREKNSFMNLDDASLRNLELIKTIRTGSKKGSLLDVLDRTSTSAGSRLLTRYIKTPLIDIEKIRSRQLRTEELYNNPIVSENIAEILSAIFDLERICSKLSSKTILPADFVSLKSSISNYQKLLETIESSECEQIKSDFAQIDQLSDILELIDKSINEDKEVTDKFNKSSIIKEGYNSELDEYRHIRSDSGTLLKEIEDSEREKTNISTLKLKNNKVFGYFLEVPKSRVDEVPDYYIRKQTLANAERYFTQDLKELEEKIVDSEEKINSLETSLYNEIIEKVSKEIPRIQEVAASISELDVYNSFAIVARDNDYVKPELNEDGIMEIVEGRHPVVEKIVGSNFYIPNDLNLSDDEYFILITGPNMAGKSTYIRQNALIVLLAQIGSFVPAKSANISVVDRIFTRVGASDDLSTGQSTFMVEMNEVSNILKNATDKSLVILDEIGRGTSTYDGISIAWALCEDLLSRNIKTLFATHYHELTELENEENGLANFNIEVKEKGDEVLFLRKINRGKTDQSYGIQVAKLAGFPNRVTDRAQELLKRLERIQGNLPEDRTELLKEESLPSEIDNSLSPLEEFLETLNPDELTPREALDKLYEIQSIYENKNA